MSPRQQFFIFFKSWRDSNLQQNWRLLMCVLCQPVLPASLVHAGKEQSLPLWMKQILRQILSGFSVYCFSHLPSSLEPRGDTLKPLTCVFITPWEQWCARAGSYRLVKADFLLLFPSVHWRTTCWQLRTGHGWSLFTPQKWANMTIRVLFLPLSLAGGLVCITYSLNIGKVLFKWFPVSTHSFTSANL